MKAKNILTIGNITTIINTIALIISGAIIGFLISIGCHIPFNEVELATIISAVLFAIFGYVNAKYQNNFWDNKNNEINIPVNLNDAQTQAIQTFIENHTGEKVNINTSETDEEFIEDLDIAGEYE